MKITVDTQNAYRIWPHVEKFQNTTLRYTPSPSCPKVMEQVIGRPAIIRLFITLDEVWDYRTNTYYWDYPIGVNRYPGDQNHYDYDWPLTTPAPGNTHIQEYLTSHAASADAVLLNLRRYERETIDGVITHRQYEAVFEKVVAFYKKLCPNITYIECCNEVELVQFGKLTINEYYSLYQCAYRSIQRLNQKHNYEIPLKVGGFGLSHGITHWHFWQEFLELLSQDEHCIIDFYSMHEYHTNPQRIMEFCMRHQELVNELKLPDLPLLMTEYGLRVGLGDAGRPTNIQNASGEIAGMILGSHYTNLKMFPWCTFHNPHQQLGRTMFILNEANEYLPTPNGHTMTMFKMLGDRELLIEEYLENKAVATIDAERICILVSNPGQNETDTEIVINNLDNGKYLIKQYMVNSHTNNCLSNPACRSLQATKELNLLATEHQLNLNEHMSGDSFCLWTIKSIYQGRDKK